MEAPKATRGKRGDALHTPARARFLNDAEWTILTGVFGSSLPLRYRILITDGLGGGHQPFTIPTAAISALRIPAAIQSALTVFVTTRLSRVGVAQASDSNNPGTAGSSAPVSQLPGMVNAGYIVSVGYGPYPDLSRDHADPARRGAYRALLVHELTHVWQGANGTWSTTCANNSIMNQCRSDFGTGSHDGAFGYTPGSHWRMYNPEQQASIVEDWYVAGKPESGPLWPYVRDFVRKGVA